MPASSRFAVAVHILAVLASARKKAHASEAIAASVRTNPSVVRRILGDLSRAGMTTSQLGKGGGAMLARGPKRISLFEVYHAVEQPTLVPMHRNAPSETCDIGRTIQPALRAYTSKAEQAFFDALSSYSLKDVMRSLKAEAA